MTLNKLMKEENWQEIREIFDDALRRKPAERSEFVRLACEGKDDLRAEVESLLASLDAAEEFLEPAISTDVTEVLEHETVRMERGKCFGHYEIVEQIGAGGMGEVYLARDKKLDRKVAVKVLNEKFSRDKSNLKRFVAEAKAASALNHPNILVIHEIGTEDEAHYIVSEFVKGRTLRQLLKESPLQPAEIVDYAIQIASALSSAHEAQLIHRDVKPENIIVRPDGFVKVLDFGLAKLIGRKNRSVLGLEDSTLGGDLTAKGMILGTVNYMSPEQAKGESVDERADIFSLGVVLYEMISGKRPFEGDSISESFANLINKDPEPLDAHIPDVPAELQSIVSKMLRKNRDDRYQTMRELLAVLKELRDAGHSGSAYKGWAASSFDNRTAVLPQTTGGAANATANNSSIYEVWHKRWRIEGAIVLILALCAGGYWMWHRSNTEWVRSQVAHVEELARAANYFEAFDLASRIEQSSPGDPALTALMPTISDTLTVNSEPAGAQVYLKRYQPDQNGAFPDRVLIGTTPIKGIRIPKGPQIAYIEKDGYAPVQTVISNRQIKFGENMLWNPSTTVEISRDLMRAEAVPDKMIFVPGGEYRLASSQRPTDDKVKLDDYFIDKYEVSNKDFKEFVSAGGYARQEYWKVPVVKDGRTLSWQEAMSLFHDRTSLQGPRDWSNQSFPDGKADHPVTGITWYEAAAYAEFRGKKLPTVFQWEKAARNGTHQDASYKMPWGDQYPGDSFANRANFENNGTVAVDSEEFGISEFGAYNMAGNVSEWLLNKGSDGYYATGGAWGEPVYTFSYSGEYPGSFESSRRGFRCVRLVAADRASGDQGGTPLQNGQTVQAYERTTDAQFREIARPYDYAKTPLDAEVVEAVETADWRREKITFNGAGGKRAIAYLYLPHNASRPLQVVQMMAGSDVENGITAVPVSAEGWLGSVVRSGRALLAVVTEGNSERPWPADFKKPPYESVEWRDLVVARFTDHRRGLDYLETRGDIDMSRAAYVGISAGAAQGIILPAIENRYRSVFLVSAGLPSFFKANQPAANPINFAPHIRQPKYVLNGRFDENFPVKSTVEPMLDLFPDPKELQLYEGPHAPPMEVLVPALNKFFDRTLGPVRRQ